MHAPLTRLTAQFAPPQPDGDLLARFVHNRDEAAFAALVHRHGPTVYGACRRLLGNSADADDAFQTVFLVLANRAGALAHRPALGGWLHEVAVRVAKKARTAFGRLRKHERRAAQSRTEPVLDAPPDDPPAWLDRELAALPERYREPVVQCLIRERPRTEVAAELGIPEGTLASRLDAARKRLAERLARHRVPLALGGLLVPVPAPLAAATARRAVDGAGAAIHQLANEVTKAMFPNTKWIALSAVAILTAVGGLLLAADSTVPPAPKAGAVPTARRAAPVPQQKEPPEPAWMGAFRKAYELKDGEYVRRVPLPLPAERADFFLTHFYKTWGTERDRQTRLEFSRWSAFCTLFVEQDGKVLRYQRSLSSMYLQGRPELQRGENLLTVPTLIELVTGRDEPEFVIDPKSKDAPLFEKGNLTVSGDFVMRRNAPLDKLVPQLERILRTELKLDVRLTLKDEEQAVIVVGGAFKLVPPEWRERTVKEVDVYATTEGLNKEYQFAQHDRGRERAAVVTTSTYTGTPTEFVRFIGSRVGTRMVWDTDLPAGPKFSWHNHTVRNPNKEEEAADRDPEKILPIVTAQTGLTFKKEKRKVQVLYLSAPEQK